MQRFWVVVSVSRMQEVLLCVVLLWRRSLLVVCFVCCRRTRVGIDSCCTICMLCVCVFGVVYLFCALVRVVKNVLRVCYYSSNSSSSIWGRVII